MTKINKDYIIKDEDELVLNGYQLREWKKMIIEDYKNSEYQNTKWRKGRREGFLIAFKKIGKMLENYDVEACCHGIRLTELEKRLKEIEIEGDRRYKIGRKQLDFIRKSRSENPPRPYWWIARELKVSQFTCMYWSNAELRKKQRWKNRNRSFGKDKIMESSENADSTSEVQP